MNGLFRIHTGHLNMTWTGNLFLNFISATTEADLNYVSPQPVHFLQWKHCPGDNDNE